MAETVLSSRELNRALLDRQMLLQRERRPAAEVIEHLVGLQAQEPMPPYYGLWSRLEGFDPHELGRMITEREVVRMTLLRGTIHLATVRDAVCIRPLIQVVLDRMTRPVRRALGNDGLARLADTVGQLLADEPQGARAIARALVEHGIGADVGAEKLGYSINAFVPLIQMPPRAVWGEGGRVRYATLEAWTGRELDPDPSVDDLVLRYLAAFGPASVMDMQNWSGLTRLKQAFERLRPQLATFRDEYGTELFDLPDAPRPDPETPAPVRLLGEYDNILLGHRDRRRIIPEGFPWDQMLAHGRFVNNLLLDGILRATWWIDRDGKRSATLSVRPHGKLTPAERDEIEAEAARMLEFVAGEVERREVRFERAEP